MAGQAIRICLVLEPSGGGSGRHVLDLAMGLKKLGHDVSLIWSPVRAQTEWATAAEQVDGVESYKVDMYRSVGKRDFSSYRQLKKLISKIGPFDIIHGHSSKAGALVRMLPNSIPGKRVYTPHAFVTMDPNLNPLKRKLFGAIERFLSTKGHATIAVSSAELEHARSLKINGKISSIVNGVDENHAMSRTEAREFMNVSAESFAVGFVGRLSYQKNPERFMDIIAAAHKQNPSVKGILIGDGELMDVLQSKTSGTPSCFSFLGWQDAAALMIGLDCFLMSSRYEAMPYTYLEALSAGLPIFSTRVGGACEAVRDNENGMVFSQSEEDGIIGLEISKLATNKIAHKKWSKSSSLRSKEYSIDNMVAHTQALYFQVLGQ